MLSQSLLSHSLLAQSRSDTVALSSQSLLSQTLAQPAFTQPALTEPAPHSLSTQPALTETALPKTLAQAAFTQPACAESALTQVHWQFSQSIFSQSNFSGFLQPALYRQRLRGFFLGGSSRNASGLIQNPPFRIQNGQRLPGPLLASWRPVLRGLSAY